MLQFEIKSSFIALGNFLQQFTNNGYKKLNTVTNNEMFYDDFVALIALSQSHNGWFTPEQVLFSVESWAASLTEDNLNTWISKYDFSKTNSKKVGLILAGNIPLVGFHDFVCVLLSGHQVLVKTSSNDAYLIKFLSKYLIATNSKLADKITFIDGKLEGFDAIIATGSNNTSRYFEYYFKNVPSIIRKNRNSVAVLNGEESFEDLIQLGEDIFRYFGLGCRNVSKLFVPEGYDFKFFFEAVFTYKEVIFYEKYANNYDYNKAVFLMSNYKLLDNEFLTLKEDTNYASPISSVFYEYYKDLTEVENRFEKDSNQIQCIVSNNLVKNSIPFGTTQKPSLWDYADDVDTLLFLSKL